MSVKTHPLTGRVVFTKNRGTSGKAHYMETENRGYCGRYIEPGKPMAPNWNPDDNEDLMCRKCLEWYRIINKPKKA